MTMTYFRSEDYAWWSFVLVLMQINVVPTFFGEYFELVALMGSWAQGISWLKFASVCRLLSFRVKLYLNLAPATAAIIWHTAQRTFMPRLDSPQTFRLRQCSWMKFRPLKLFVHYWNERDKNRYNQGLWNVCLAVMCGEVLTCARV